MRLILTSMVFALGFIGCGKKSTVQAPAPTISSEQNAGGNSCSKRRCLAAEMGIAASGLAGDINALVGFKNENVAWNFDGVDQGYEGRNVGVFLRQIPDGGEVSNEGVRDSIRLDWTPSNSGPGDMPLVVVTRDLDRCILEAKDEDDCQEQVLMEDFDVETPMNFEIVDRNELERAAAEAGQTNAGGQDCGTSKEEKILSVGTAVAGGLGGGGGDLLKVFGPLLGGLSGGDKSGC